MRGRVERRAWPAPCPSRDRGRWAACGWRVRGVRRRFPRDSSPRPRPGSGSLRRRRRAQVADVPYDCGAAFVHDPDVHRETFTSSAAYLGQAERDRPVFSNLGPEMSRRARALAVWATLHAYGRSGYQAMVERHVRLAGRLAAQVDADPDLQRLAEVPLNVVCFRYQPSGVAESELDDLNRRLGQAVLDDGRIYFGTTVYDGKVAFRPAIVKLAYGRSRRRSHRPHHPRTRSPSPPGVVARLSGAGRALRGRGAVEEESIDVVVDARAAPLVGSVPIAVVREQHS